MSGLAFRFLHTSDWHLELPASGLVEVPDHLREALVEAPYLAAERVIETALAERAFRPSRSSAIPRSGQENQETDDP